MGDRRQRLNVERDRFERVLAQRDTLCQHDRHGLADIAHLVMRQYRLLVTMNLKLRDVRRNSVLFEQQSLREKADFQVLGAVSQTIGAEEGAVRSAAIEIARSIVSLTIDRF